jgi:hypothetical protein
MIEHRESPMRAWGCYGLKSAEKENLNHSSFLSATCFPFGLSVDPSRTPAGSASAILTLLR